MNRREFLHFAASTLAIVNASQAGVIIGDSVYDAADKGKMPSHEDLTSLAVLGIGVVAGAKAASLLAENKGNTDIE